jgi:hypothetical protein
MFNIFYTMPASVFKLITTRHNTLVEMAQTTDFLTYFSYFLEAASPKSGYKYSQFLVKALFQKKRSWLPSWYIQTWQKERECVSYPLMRALLPLEVLTLVISCKHNYLSIPHLQKPTHCGISLST